jgi:hypothetical protein
MLDRALSKTFANFSTLLLLACVITLPVHVVHAFVFRNVLAVQEIGPEIAAFPEGRQVRGVAKGDLVDERNWLLIALAAELVLLPLAYRAARRVIAVDDAGGVPTVLDAWGHLGNEGGSRVSIGPVGVAGAIGIASGWLVWMIGKLLADMASADIAWALIGLFRGFAMAVAIAFVVGVGAALAPKVVATPKPAEEIDLY